MRDSGEFSEFYASTAPRVVAQIYAMVGDLAEAEDAVQEAYARAWARWARVSAYEDPVGWVRTVGYRIAVSSWRRSLNRWRAHQRSQPARPPVVAALNPDTVALVAALRQLPLAQRRALVLFYLAGRSVQEIAHDTGATQSAVKAQLSRGRQALAPLLSVDGTTEVDQHA